MGREIFCGKLGIVIINDFLVDKTIVPGEFFIINEVGQGLSARGVDDCDSWDTVDEAELF